jgi:hypothetical protein
LVTDGDGGIAQQWSDGLQRLEASTSIAGCNLLIGCGWSPSCFVADWEERPLGLGGRSPAM